MATCDKLSRVRCFCWEKGFVVDHDRYKYKYEKEFVGNSWNHSYSLTGRYGALSLNIRDYKDSPSTGLEYHYRSPLSHMRDIPSQNKCYLLQAPCWHDGTSLYAEEQYLPLFKLGQDDYIFNRLTADANNAFYPSEDSL